MLNVKTLLPFALSSAALATALYAVLNTSDPAPDPYIPIKTTLSGMQAQLDSLSDVSLQIANEEAIKTMEKKMNELEINSKTYLQQQDRFIAETRKELDKFAKTLTKFQEYRKKVRRRLPSRKPEIANKSIPVKLLSIDTLSGEGFVTLKSQGNDLPAQKTLGETFKGWIIREIDNPPGTVIISRGKTFKTLRVVH